MRRTKRSRAFLPASDDRGMFGNAGAIILFGFQVERGHDRARLQEL